LNICLLTRSLPCHSIGGMEIITELICNKLASKDFHLTIITTKHPDNIKYIKNEHIETYYLDNCKSGKYSLNWWRESRALFHKLNKKNKFDLLITADHGNCEVM